MFAMKIEADWLIVMKNALNKIGLFRYSVIPYSVFSGVPQSMVVKLEQSDAVITDDE